MRETIFQLFEEAKSLGIDYLQFFLLPPDNDSQYITLNNAELKKVKALKQLSFKDLYIHSSYWINPAAGKKASFEASQLLLKKEIVLAKKLEVNHVVLHAGSATGHKTKPDDPIAKHVGIQTVAMFLNELLKDEHDVTILLENTAHGNRAIGSDLQDFVLLKELLNYPEKIGYCIDFAHAFTYGYDLSDADAFIALLDVVCGIGNIKLLHLNDSAEKFESKKDTHALPGQGFIGKTVLQQLINHPRLAGIPCIIEPPANVNHALNDCLSEIVFW